MSRLAAAAANAWADSREANRRLAEMKIDLGRDNAF